MMYWDFRGRSTQFSQQTRNQLTTSQHHADMDRPHASTYIGDDASGVTQNMLTWRANVCGEEGPASGPTQEDLRCPSDSAGFYWAMMGMVRYADRPIAFERRTVMATKPTHHPGAPNPPINKVYYHSSSFRDASASVNYPAAIGNPAVSFNGYVDRCIPFAQVIAVVGEPWFPAENGAVEFPEGRQPRRD